MKLTYDISTLVPYINWAYFYFAWQLKDEANKQRMRSEAESFLASIQGKYYAHALFKIVDAHAEGDDIIIEENGKRLPFLRQQEANSEFLCLADFISGEADKVGLFATSVDAGMETDFDDDPYEKMMAQLLADRLAEAAAERMHEEVRKHYWGYAKDENLSIHDMQLEKFVGIRPAVGYPSLPDTSMNFLLDDLLGMQQIGITLTESGAMRPHASVSGLMEDYAKRRQMPVNEMRKFLIANL